MTVRGLRFEHVVQVRTATAFGTGYLVAPGLVLTAAHLLGDGEVVVSRPAEETREDTGRVVWQRHDDQADAALVALGPASEPGLPPRFGVFVTTRARQQVQAVGFPRLQKGADLRDQEHFAGELSPGTGAVSQRYELTSTTPLPPADPSRTPWAGMSGAAVFSAGLLVGVVRQDRRAATGARLTATPLATLIADETFRAALREHTSWEPIAEPVELAPVLTSPYRTRGIRSIASLLRADARTVGFHGRDQECARLVRWCDTTGPASALLVTGQGGTGKTRLAHWFLDRQRAYGWTTGLLQPTATTSGLDLVAETQGPVLLAIDYAENRSGLVSALLRQALAAPGPVRILLLARDRGGWSDALNEPDPRVRDLLADAETITLIDAPAEWDASFRHAVRDLAAALSAVPGYGNADWAGLARDVAVPPAETDVRPATALGVQMTALTRLLERATTHQHDTEEPVERTLLRHEEAYWTQSATRLGLHGLDPRTRREAVAALLLTTPANRDEGVAVLNRLGVRDTDRGRVATRWLAELYPSEDGAWTAIQPDRIAEYLLAAVCADESDLLPRLVTGADDEAQVLTLLRSVRAAQSQLYFGNPVDALLTQIERTTGLPAISDSTVAWAVTNAMALPPAGTKRNVTELPDGSTRISATLDTASAALIVAGHARQADGLPRTDPRQAGFSHTIRSLALGQLGRHAEALDATDQAIASFRIDAASTEQLATELRRRAELLVVLGRADEATAALEESVALHQDGPALGDVLDLLIQHLVRDGHAVRAASHVEREVALRRKLATDPRAVEILGRALGRQGELLTGLGNTTAANAALTEALAVFDRLRDADGTDQAKVRAALAHCHDRTGDHRAALAEWQVAAGIWRGLLGADDENAARVGLAQCLNNAAVCEVRSQDLPAALALQQEAAAVVEAVREHRPDLYVTTHANLVRYLINGGAPERGVSAARQLAEQYPSGLSATLAWDLRTAAETLGAQGKFTEALDAGQLALTVLRAAPDASDAAFLTAAVLKDMSANLADLGRYDEGAQAAAEAARAWRNVRTAPQGMDEVQVRWNLAATLANQAANLRAAGRLTDAAAAFGEAATELRAVLPDRPGLRPMLADLLDGQARSVDETGDPAAAERLLREVVAIRRSYPADDPTHVVGLARALLGLVRALLKLRRPQEALPNAREAVDLYFRLHGNEPAQYDPEYASAFFLAGMSHLYAGEPVVAAAPLIRALGMAAAAGDTATADSAFAALHTAARQDPAVRGEWHRITGLATFPGD